MQCIKWSLVNCLQICLTRHCEKTTEFKYNIQCDTTIENVDKSSYVLLFIVSIV